MYRFFWSLLFSFLQLATALVRSSNTIQKNLAFPNALILQYFHSLVFPNALKLQYFDSLAFPNALILQYFDSLAFPNALILQYSIQVVMFF